MFNFKTIEDYDKAWEIAHSAILYWKKIQQDAQGKICMQCDGSHTHYTAEEAEAKTREALKFLLKIENTPHYEWNGDEFIWISEVKEFSSIIRQNQDLLGDQDTG